MRLGRIVIGSYLCLAAAASPVGATIFSVANQVCGESPKGFLRTPDVLVGLVPEDGVGSDDCANLCEKLVATCKGLLMGVKSCWQIVSAKAATLQRAECRTSDAAVEETCLAQTAIQLQDLKQLLRADVEEGQLLCADALDGCIIRCN